MSERLYGLWDSPISSDMMAGQKRLNDVRWAGDGETILWVEGRGKKGVIVAKRGAEAQRDISGDISVRGGVGYGGGEFDVHDNIVVFAASDGRLYRVSLNKGQPRPISPEFGNCASPTISPDGRWVAYVWTDGQTDVLAVVDVNGRQWPQKIVVGADFYMQPCWNPDSSRLAWIAWDHPNMPWDQTRLETATVTAADNRGVKLGSIEVWVSDNDAAVQQPLFSPDGRYLAYISDKSGFGHIYLRDLRSGDDIKLTKNDVEYGTPAWVQGIRQMAWSIESTHLAAIKNERGLKTLVRLSIDSNETPYASTTHYESIAQPIISDKGHVAFLGSSPKIPPRVVTLVNGETPRVEARATNERVAADRLAPMRPISWKATSGGQEIEVFGNYYEPTNPDFTSSGKPPAIVMVHGGPTGQRTAAYEARNQFFATRGIAVIDVNYRGSTGYGREYQDSLRGNWGIYDVEDCVSAAKFLVDADMVDPDRLMIMGGSAGGYTVLQTLTDQPGAFRAGICLYGIGNIFTLTTGTHKFESRYNDQLFGKLPEASQIFRDRSPLFKADRIEDALAIYHGAEDKVVPIDQAEDIVSSLRSRGVEHFYHRYEDEGHGWRKPENIKHFFDSLMDFIRQHVIFG